MSKTKSKKSELPEHVKTAVQSLNNNYIVRRLVTSAPHYKFEKPGDQLACKVLSKIIPTDGEYAGKLIGWNVVNIDTGETIMVGNTHQIEKAFTTDEQGVDLWETGVSFLVVWNGKSSLGNGKSFNNYDIGVIED